MININDITIALIDQLKNNQAVTNIFTTEKITRGEYVNVDESRVPWLGVYRGKVRYEPRTLGPVDNWEGFPDVKILVQALNYKSGEEVENQLDKYIKIVIEAVVANTTIGNTVDMVNSFDVEYLYREDERETIFFQTAVITLNLEVKTQ